MEESLEKLKRLTKELEISQINSKATEDVRQIAEEARAKAEEARAIAEEARAHAESIREEIYLKLKKIFKDL
jgi:uncharacterized coiled-coil DUF342 family protein